MFDKLILGPKDEPEVRRAKARRYVAWCNGSVHDAPWTNGDMSGNRCGGVLIALELAEQAYQAHRLPYKRGLSNLSRYDPRRFTWLCDVDGDGEECVKLRDNRTGRTVIWPHF